LTESITFNYQANLEYEAAVFFDFLRNSTSGKRPTVAIDGDGSKFVNLPAGKMWREFYPSVGFETLDAINQVSSLNSGESVDIKLSVYDNAFLGTRSVRGIYNAGDY